MGCSHYLNGKAYAGKLATRGDFCQRLMGLPWVGSNNKLHLFKTTGAVFALIKSSKLNQQLGAFHAEFLELLINF